MRGVLLYYSSTGNTKLASEYLAARLSIPVDLVDVARERAVDLGRYRVVGLATWTDFGGPPKLFLDVLKELPAQSAKPAFVLNTYGAVSIKTLRVLARAATRKGFAVIAGHSVQMPESYPPMIASGRGAEGAPDERQVAAFDAFISELDWLLVCAQEGKTLPPRRPQIGMLNSLLPALARTRARADMGAKYVDTELCVECGLCAKQCPYDAIELRPAPVFDPEACYGCWRCYHRCPQHAIYTAKFRGGPYYAGPSAPLRAKLSRCKDGPDGHIG